MPISKRLMRILVGILLSPIILAVLALVIINVVDWDKHRDWVASLVERFTDYEVDAIEGIRVKLFTSAEVGVTLLKIHSSVENSVLQTFESKDFYAKIAVFPLIFKNSLIVRSFLLDSGRIKLIETTAEQRKDDEGKEEFTLKSLPSLFIYTAAVNDTRLTYQPKREGRRIPKPFDLRVEHIGITSPDDEVPSKLTAEGKANELPFEVVGAFGSFNAFRDDKAAYPASIQAKVADNTLAARGSAMLAKGESDFDVAAEGPNIEKFKKAFNIDIGEIPAYKLSFVLKKLPTRVKFDDIKFLLGKTSISGHGGLDFGERTLIKADLVSPIAFHEDFKGLFQTDKNNKQPDEVPKAPGQYFSSDPIHAEGLKAVDADIKIDLKRFEGQKAATAVDGIEGRILLNRGKLVIDPLRFNVAKGTLGGNFLLDARKPKLDVRLTLGARGISLDQLLAPIATEVPVFKLKPTDMAKGILSGHIALQMQGKTAKEMAEDLSGPFELAVDEGKLSATIVELFGIDISETIGNWIKGNPMDRLECSLMVFEAKKGVFETKAFLISTSDTNIVGKGQLDLPGNKADFLLSARPRDISIGSIKTPLYIKGPLNDIKAGLVAKDAALRGAAAVALGLIAPGLAVLPFIENGVEKGGKCEKLVAEIKGIEARSKADVAR